MINATQCNNFANVYNTDFHAPIQLQVTEQKEHIFVRRTPLLHISSHLPLPSISLPLPSHLSCSAASFTLLTPRGPASQPGEATSRYIDTAFLLITNTLSHLSFAKKHTVLTHTFAWTNEILWIMKRAERHFVVVALGFLRNGLD